MTEEETTRISGEDGVRTLGGEPGEECEDLEEERVEIRKDSAQSEDGLTFSQENLHAESGGTARVSEPGEDTCQYEDDFEADGEEQTTTDESSVDLVQSPSHKPLSHRAVQLINGKKSEILDSFSGVEDEESQYVLNKNCDVEQSSSASSDEEGDEVDGDERDSLDGVPDTHRLQRLHSIIRNNDHRKFRWFISLFLSDVEELEELCQVSQDGFTALSLLGGLGRTKMLKQLSEAGVLLYHQDSEGQAAIHRAVRNGHVKTTNYLCTLGQDSYQDGDGMTPLHICATKLHVKVMEVLLQHCSKPDIPYGSSHLTPLMLACMNGCVPMVDCLLQHGAEIDASNSVGNTCLHLAAANNQLGVIQKLLEHEHVEDVINKQNKQGATALHTALQLHHLDVVNRLLEAGADHTVQEQHGMSAVHVAAVLGVEAAITLLEIHGADLGKLDKRGASPLLLAVSKRRKQMVMKLLSLGVDVNLADNDGISPLHAASREGDADVVEELLRSGAHVDHVTSQGVTPLFAAITGAHTDVTKVLLNNGADPNFIVPAQSSDQRAITPMQVAFQEMRPEVIEMLLAAGGSPFQPVVSGDELPPVCIAVKRRHTNLINTVINKYNDTPTLFKLIKCCTLEDVEFMRRTEFVNHRDKQNGFGWTVLHHASMEGNTLATDILLRLSCNPNIQDHDGNTPAHFACLHGHSQLIEVLTDAYNTDITIVNNKGDACINLAVQSGKEEIVSFLLSQSSSASGDNSHLLPFLIQAITSGKNGVAEMLFANGCAETMRFNDWKQLVHMAVEQGSGRLVTLMLDKGPIDVHSSVTDSQDTCLHLAARSGNLETSLELLMHKSDVNKANALQRKPLHYAAFEGHTHIVEVLLDCGSKVSLVDEDGMPDYYLCKHLAVWDVLKKWCKTHPGSVTTSPSPSAPAADSVDAHRLAPRAARSSTNSVIGEVDGFQEIGTQATRSQSGPSGSQRSPRRAHHQSVFSHFRDALS